MSLPVRGITVAVGDWYAWTLSICLVRNMRHLTECLVVTAPGQQCVAEVVAVVPGVRMFETDAFTRHGARFNKGLALEEGFSELGREGWICLHDADILFPDVMPWDQLAPEWLHGIRRRLLDDPARWSPELDWRTCPVCPDGGPVGFAQIFHADAPSLRGKRPWYDVSFAHAGGCDAAFLSHFPPSRRKVFAVEALHLGPRDRHWFGLSAEDKDRMAAFVIRNGWTRAAAGLDPTVCDRVGEITERVEVPGYPKSEFDLPFVRRAKERARRPTL